MGNSTITLKKFLAKQMFRSYKNPSREGNGYSNQTTSTWCYFLWKEKQHFRIGSRTSHKANSPLPTKWLTQSVELGISCYEVAIAKHFQVSSDQNGDGHAPLWLYRPPELLCIIKLGGFTQMLVVKRFDLLTNQYGDGSRTFTIVQAT